MKLLLIESGGKIKKLKAILGSEWNVKATMGHIVELATDGEDALGFTLDNERKRIDCRYIPRGTKGKQILKELREAVKQASQVLIATDADREGETIGWHLAQQLHLKHPRRAVYTEITDKAVRQAIAHPRPLDLNLVSAGRCRDSLDKLVGYKGSPLLWKLGNGAKSMGRVQSATLHILCQREREIRAFVPQDYWSVFVDYEEGLRAYYAGSDTSPDTDQVTDKTDDASDLKEKQVESVRVLSQAQAEQLVTTARTHPHRAVQIDSKETSRKPPAPFTTSSLQQAAGSRLKYGSEKTMKLAQSLYEQGLITYMRTDSVALSEDYCSQARQWLQQHDPQNVPERVATQRSKAGAQEAHEAIRPTDVDNLPDSLTSKISQEEVKLYSLIWGRTLASQCRAARVQKTRILTQSGEVFWQARGQVVTFRGYTIYWNDIAGNTQLPVVKQGQQLRCQQAEAEKKQTQPPPRYTEPKLVQKMEKLGIGRPSTYAPTCKILRERDYASLHRGHLQPTQLGMEVDEFLLRVLPKMVEPEFTAEMEGQLDVIAAGKQQWEPYLIDWNQTYFAPALAAAYRTLGANQGVKPGSPKQAELTEIHCPKCEWLMQKILCHSQKLKADHFLKCANKACGAAMFWSEQQQGYELPYSERKGNTNTSNRKSPATQAATSVASPSLPSSSHEDSSSEAIATSPRMTDYACPVCGQPLELYEYTKEREQKQMLRCSDAVRRRQDDHKEVAFFAAKGVFWSPNYGEIGQAANAQKVTSAEAKRKSAQQPNRQTKNQPPSSQRVGRRSNRRSTNAASKLQGAAPGLCPVCSQPLELYEYSKGNEQKQMLRCSDAQARRQDDHKDVAFFAARGVFWSPKYGEVR
ncbi:MAG: type I DNA topoisomerase [Chroococcidiopsidaceae cyanobacterium CP_BM_RX_35]|nr:type I DNA topoisomerase [Chroococcidiopsidaceae cyanobacterium CP_BM_RX_35]